MEQITKWQTPNGRLLENSEKALLQAYYEGLEEIKRVLDNPDRSKTKIEKIADLATRYQKVKTITHWVTTDGQGFSTYKEALLKEKTDVLEEIQFLLEDSLLENALTPREMAKSIVMKRNQITELLKRLQ